MEEYFGITRTDLKLVEFDSIQKDEAIMFWIKKIDTGRVYITYVGNEWPIYKYIIYDTELNETNLKIGTWEVISILEGRVKHSLSRTFFRIKDKNGRIVRFQYPPKWHTDILNEMEERSILRVIKLLKEVKGLDCWNSVLLYFDNKKLKKEVAALKEKLIKHSQ